MARHDATALLMATLLAAVPLHQAPAQPLHQAQTSDQAQPSDQPSTQPSPGAALADASGLPSTMSDLLHQNDQSEDIAARYHHDRMTIPVHIDGSGPYAFLVDTGSEATVISHQLAASLGIAQSGQARLIGTVAASGVATTRVRTLGVGREMMENLPAILLDANHLGAAGILGIDTLKKHRVVFDFANDSVSIAPSGLNKRGDTYEIVVTARRKQDRMVISNARIDGIRVNLIIDTGSNYSIGNSALRDRLRQKATFGQAGLMDVTGARLSTDIVKVDSIQFDSLRLEKSFLLISDSPAFKELGLDKKPAVLLGMNHLRAFSRMSVDFSRREVAFDLAE